MDDATNSAANNTCWSVAITIHFVIRIYLMGEATNSAANITC